MYVLLVHRQWSWISVTYSVGLANPIKAFATEKATTWSGTNQTFIGHDLRTFYSHNDKLRISVPLAIQSSMKPDCTTIGRGYANSKKVKMALSLKMSGILWWHFTYTYWYWQDLAQGIVKCHLSLVEALPRSEFWKRWNWPYLLNLLEYFDKILYTHFCWQDLDRGIAKCHLSSAEAMPMSKILNKYNWNGYGTFSCVT